MSGRRSTPPSGHPGEVIRRRLDDLLIGRWSHRVTVIKAGPGFGKSTLAAQAVRRNHVRPLGIDVWFGCVPSDRDASRFAAGLADVVGATVEAASTADQMIVAVVDELARRSPTSVCLVLDDVHRLGVETSAATALAQLVSEAPDNLHVVLVGRTDPPIPMTRLRASRGLLELVEQDLVLDDDEACELGVDPAAARELGGWPALVALSGMLGRPAAQQFLVEELLGGLDEHQQLALGLSAVLGGLDAELLTELTGTPGDPIGLLGDLPLVDLHGDVAVAHDLWWLETEDVSSAVEAIRPEAWRRAVDVLIGRDDHERALEVALRFELHEVALDVVLDAIGRRLPAFPADVAERWLSRLPDELHDRPAAVMLAAAARVDDPSERVARLGGAAAQLTDAGRHDDGLTALALQVYYAYSAGDLATVLGVRATLDSLPEPPGGLLGSIAVGVDALLADLSGEPWRSVELLDPLDLAALPPDLRVQLTRLRTNGLVLTGRAAQALDEAADLLGSASDPFVRSTMVLVAHLAGDMRSLIGVSEPSRDEGDLPGHDLIFQRAVVAHLRAAIGESSELEDGLWDLADGNDRLRALLATAAAASSVAAGDDEEAVANRLRERLAEVTVSGLGRTELRRFPAVVEVLLPGEVPLAPEPGPSVAEPLAIASLMRAARAGDLRADSAGPAPERAATCLPLRWSAELAARARAAGASWGDDLAATVADLAGDRVAELLTEQAASDDASLAEGAAALLATVPLRPSDPVRLELLGPVIVRRGGHEVDDALLRRQRVRQILALLAADESINRWRLLDLLWPEADQDKALRNLRTNLSHVRRLLEPDVGGRRASYFLRSDGERLRLTGAALHVDLWELLAHLDAAAAAEDGQRLDDAIAEYRAAVALWRGEPFLDLVDVDQISALRADLTAKVLVAATRGAELLVARGDHAAAADLAMRAIEIDPLDEGAHRAAIAAAVYRRDRPGLDRAVARLREALDELGVSPTAETAMVLELAGDLAA
ncbi:MAG: BTAD domain-containing putative transcriptional regulator [Actinomycetota bacterium]